MSEMQTSKYEDENDTTVKFEEFIGAIKPYMEGKDLKTAVEIIKKGVRGYFLSVGKSLTNIKENVISGNAVHGSLKFVKELPTPNEQFELTNAKITIALNDDKVTVYHDVDEGWINILDASGV